MRTINLWIFNYFSRKHNSYLLQFHIELSVKWKLKSARVIWNEQESYKLSKSNILLFKSNPEQCRVRQSYLKCNVMILCMACLARCILSELTFGVLSQLNRCICMNIRIWWAEWAISNLGFGRLVNPISIRQERLCPTHYYLSTQL